MADGDGESTAPTPEELARINEAKRLYEELEQSLLKAAMTQEKLNAGLAEQDRLLEAQQTRVTQIRAEQDALDRIKRTIAENELASTTALKDLEDERTALKEAEGEVDDQRIASLEKAIDLRKEEEKINERITGQQKNLERLREQLADNQKKFNDETASGVNEVEDALSSMAGKVPIIGKQLSDAIRIKSNALEFANDIGKIGKAMNNPRLVKGATKFATFVEGISFKMMAAYVAAAAFVGIAAKMALEVNNLSKQLAAATGFGDEFNNEIRRMGVSGSQLGIGFKESAEALGSMANGLSSFNMSNEKVNTRVGMTVAKLSKLGVTSAESVKSIDHMQRAMNLSADAAANKTAQIARMGKAIGITGTKMINDFNAASARLAIFGKDNIKVFKGLAAAAKATGMEINTLINISKKFDQFDTAADSAAQLNAVLGTNLSTLEMMNATDEERVMMIKQQVQASVGNFDSLDKFTKQYVAQAMGVASVDEAQRLLNMSTAEYQKYKSGQKESADIQKELSDAVADTVPLMSQLKLALVSLFMAFEPLITGFSVIIQGVSFLFRGFASLFSATGDLSTAMTVLKTIMTAIGIALLVIFTPVSATVGAVIGFVAAIGALWDIIHKPGSKSIAGGIFGDIGKSIMGFAMGLANPIKMVTSLARGFTGLFKSIHPKDEGNKFDIEAMAKLDTSKIATGFNEIKSAVMELANIKVSGMLAFQSDGARTSMIMGSVATEMAMLLNGGKIEVDIKMPEMAMPEINVKVYIGDRELRDIIRTEVQSAVGAAG